MITTANPLTVLQAAAALARAIGGKRYAIDLELLDEHSLRELLRLLRDHEKRAAVRRPPRSRSQRRFPHPLRRDQG